jgi:hypothetical protein
MPSYIRFETQRRCARFRRRLGVFRMAGEVEESTDLPEVTAEWLQETLDWFNRNLTVPKYDRVDRRGIFWFRRSCRTKAYTSMFDGRPAPARSFTTTNNRSPPFRFDGEKTTTPGECAGIARDASNVEEGVQFLYWALNLLNVFPSSECAGFARNPAKVEDQVQFLARACRGRRVDDPGERPFSLFGVEP